MPYSILRESIAMALLIHVLLVVVVMPVTALAAEVTGTVTEVTGDTIVITTDAPVGAGDRVEIYFEIPGVEELVKVGSGRVVGVESGRIVARIEQYTGKLAIGQIAKIQASGAAPPLGGAQTFSNPTTQGHHVDRCLNWAQQCDEPAASAWCRTQGYSRATDWKWEYMKPTYVLGDGQVCNEDYCGGFSTITCSR
jgi:hypothetical protein